jgi:hypothetical protein
VKGKKRERKDYKHGLPVFSVDTVSQAAFFIEQIGVLKWIGGGPALVPPNFSGEVTQIQDVTALFQELWDKHNGVKNE